MNSRKPQPGLFGSSSERYPVLLLGFNRPEKTRERAQEILQCDPSMLYISIDGPRNQGEEVTRKEIVKQLREFKSNHNVMTIYREKNLGLEKHLPQAINEILKQHNGVIIIEDDVQCSTVFYKEVSEAMYLYGDEYMTIGGFSPISFDIKMIHNRWRPTKYFSAWGWGVTKSSWEKYEPIIDHELIERELESSRLWHELGNFQKNTWLGRFQKVATGNKKTWDFQMQYSSFKHDLLHLNVLFRICENVGFGDIRGTNTKTNRPTLLGREYLSQSKFVSHRCPGSVQRFFEILDSIVIAGDRKIPNLLSKRRLLKRTQIIGRS